MSYLKIPKNYKPLLDARETELGIKKVKDFFKFFCFLKISY
jgi:aspartate--ammonia ligase